MGSMKAPPWFWATIAIVGVVSVGGSAKTSYDTRETNDRLKVALAQVAEAQRCINGFLAENKRVSNIRAAATAERDEAEVAANRTTTKLIDGITDLPSGGSLESARKYRELIAEYKESAMADRKAALKLKKEREKNPLPDVPAACSDLPVVTDE